MVSDEEKSRRRAKLNDIAASIRADLGAIRLAERLSSARVLPMTRRTFAEELVDRETAWDAADRD